MRRRDTEFDNVTLLGCFRGLLIGAPISGIVHLVHDTVAITYRVPEATYLAYKALIKETRIGPNLKVVTGATIPIIAVLIPPTAAIGSLGYGVFEGFSSSLRSLSEMKKATCKSLKILDTAIIKDIMPNFRDYIPRELKEDEVPFDIKITGAMKSLLSMFVTIPLEVVGNTALIIVNMPMIYLRELEDIFKHMPAPVNFFFLILAWILTPLAIPLTALVSAGVGVFTGGYYGYRKGVRAAIKQSVDYIKEFNSSLSKLFHE